VVGAVREPGVYDLRHDEMSLVTAVLKAGGITEDNGGTIRIRRGTSSEEARALMLPVRGVDVPFVDVDLRPGDTIEIERREPEQFTVIGLVRRPGAFAYPNGSEYTLLQALATAGGTDELADPRYATIYRQTAGGELVHATYAIQKLGGEDGNPRIKPGDVVAVEHTARTQFRVLMARLLRIGVGAGADVSYKPF
jgi:polysaccharide export outer membrane protein